MSWIVYIVRCRDGTLYTGITTDLERRLDEHDRGRGARYTRGRGPVTLLRVERRPTRGAALRREAQIKRLRADEKRRLAEGGSTRSARAASRR